VSSSNRVTSPVSSIFCLLLMLGDLPTIECADGRRGQNTDLSSVTRLRTVAMTGRRAEIAGGRSSVYLRPNFTFATSSL
jgi:hypothetical protein